MIKKRALLRGKLRSAALSSAIFVCLLLVASVIFSAPTNAAAGINKQISFQGKVVAKSDGTNVSDGSYTFRFRIYNSASADATNSCSANSCLWEETKSVTVTNGIFQTNLGDTTSLPGSIDFNTDTLYLGVVFNGDSEMTPRIRLTAVPYAFNADKLGGLSSSAFAQLSPSGQQTGSLNVSGNITSGGNVQANTIDAATSGALTLGSGNATSLALAKNTTMGSGLTMSLQGNNALSLGSNSAAGGIIFKDGTANGFTVTLSTPALAASYVLNLPGSGPGTSQCLQSGASTAANLTWGSCGGGSSSLQAAYTGGQTITLNGTNAVIVKDGSSAISGNLFAVQNNAGTINYAGISAIGFQLQHSAGANALYFDFSSNTLEVMDPSNSANYAAISYSGGTAIYGSSSGVVQFGSGTGNVNISLSGATDRTRYNKTYTASGAYSTDEFVINRSVTGGANSIGGSLLKVEDLSTGSSTFNPTLFLLNQSKSGATGYLIQGQLAGSTKFAVDVNGNLTTVGNITGAGAVTVAASGTNNLTMQSGGTGTVVLKPGSDSGSAIQLQNAGGTSLLTADTNNMRIDLKGSQSTAVLGSTLLTNGDFASGTCSSWTCGTGWAVSSNAVVHTAGNTAALSQNISVTSGVTYEIDFTQSGATSGSLTFGIGANTAGYAFWDSDTHRSVVAPSTGSLSFSVTPTTDYNGTLDNFTVKAITSPSLAVQRALNSDGTVGLEVRTGGSALNNTYIGVNAGQYNTSGFDNTAIGYGAMQSNTTGILNVAVGKTALQANTTGSWNVALGQEALFSNTTGTDNMAMGQDALYSNTNGNTNIALGSSAGYNNTTGFGNVFIGQAAGFQDPNGFSTPGTLSNAGAIGSNAQVTASNSLILGATGSSQVNVGIGITAPNALFQVAPIQYSTGTATRTNGSATLAGTGTSWTTALIGDTIVFPDGTTNTVTAVGSTTSLTMGSTYTGTTDASPVAYRIHYDGFSVLSDGTTVLTNYNSFSDIRTCDATGAGGLYYNKVTTAIRGCINGNWEDMASTSGLGLMLFGVVPDSANATTVGDLWSATATGPCKTHWASTTSVTVEPCTAYSGGRKVIVAQTTISITGMTSTAIWAHVCLTGANGQPALSATATAETASANLPAWNTNNPVLCLADVKGTGSGQNISAIYDTRTFTITQKSFGISSAALGLGQLACYGSTSQAALCSTLASGATVGVVVATNGSTSTTTPNIIFASNGPAYVKASAGTAGGFVEATTTAGYANTTSTFAAGTIGVSHTTWSSTCSSTTTCLESLYTDIHGK